MKSPFLYHLIGDAWIKIVSFSSEISLKTLDTDLKSFILSLPFFFKYFLSASTYDVPLNENMTVSLVTEIKESSKTFPFKKTWSP